LLISLDELRRPRIVTEVKKGSSASANGALWHSVTRKPPRLRLNAKILHARRSAIVSFSAVAAGLYVARPATLLAYDIVFTVAHACC
jgi:hypothetical protein